MKRLLEAISHTDKISHLFIVDIEFDFKCATEKELFFNEIYTPLFEKQKVLLASERSVFQLLDAMRLNKQDALNSYKCTAKTHSWIKRRAFEIFNYSMCVDINENLLSLYI